MSSISTYENQSHNDIKFSIREGNSLTNILASQRLWSTKMNIQDLIEDSFSKMIFESLKKDNFGSPSEQQLKKNPKLNETVDCSGVFFKDTSDCLSTSTNDSLPCPPGAITQPGKPAAEPYAALVNEAIFQGCKKVAQIKELIIKFEEFFVANKLLERPMASKFMSESTKLLSLLLPHMEEMKYQLADAITLSILYISTSDVKLSRRDFLKSIEKVVKKKCTKLSTIRKSKSYMQLTHLLGRSVYISDEEMGVPQLVDFSDYQVSK